MVNKINGYKMNIVFFQRKHRKIGNYSIENYFNGIRNLLPEGITQKLYFSKFESRGIFERAFDIICAAFHQGDINHITGDVHFLNLLMIKKKTILTIHDCGFINNSSGIKKSVLKLFWLTLPAKKSAFITFVSESSRNEFLKYINFNKSKLLVIPVFVGSHFVPKPKIFNTDKPRILHLGTAANKNPERLIDALAGLRCELIIVGKINDELIDKLKLNNIEYVNFVNLTNEEVLEQYILCDIVTLISTYEGFGMPIIEGNAVERVVITGNILSMPEVADNAACLVDPFDINSMREGFEKIINDHEYREQLIENGRKNKLKYLPQTIVNSYVDLYHKVLNGN